VVSPSSLAEAVDSLTGSKEDVLSLPPDSVVPSVAVSETIETVKFDSPSSETGAGLLEQAERETTASIVNRMSAFLFIRITSKCGFTHIVQTAAVLFKGANYHRLEYLFLSWYSGF
jgi:hypothetical protein